MAGYPDYTPPGSVGGGSDVASVNGQTGVVVLSAADVGATPDPDSVLLTPGDLTSAFGTAANLWTAVAGAERPSAWVIPDATSAYLGAELSKHVPESWDAFDVTMISFQITAVDPTGLLFICDFSHKPLRVGDTVPVETATNTWAEAGILSQFNTPGATNVVVEHKIGRGIPNPGAGALLPMRIAFRRSNAGDTFNAGTFGVLGLRLDKVDGTDDPTATSVLADLAAELDTPTGDSSIVVIGDSTSDYDTAARDWPRRLARRVGHHNAALTTQVRLWNPSSWGSYATIQTGTGPHTFSVHNASVGGWATTDAASALSSFASGITPDAVFISLGFNDSATEATFTTNYQALVDAVQAEWTGVPIVCIAQPRDQSNSNQTMRRTVIQTIATAESLGFIDMWTEFTDLSTASGHYSDNQHPSALGSERQAGRVFSAFV